jgi:lipoprotein-releasing system ATP-binding protein
MSTGNVIEARGLEKSFAGTEGRIEVLSGLDLEVRRGEVLSIVGASGVGKSTLLQILGSLDRPDGGTLRIGGQDVHRLKPKELNALRNRVIGFVFQFHFLLPEFSALENVVIPGLIGGRAWGDAAVRAEELLSRFGLAERLHHKPGELSGGEQQRVAVARALANDPEVILADEPTGNLDDASSQGLHEIVRELAREDNKTFVVVTHKRDFVKYADRVELLKEGVLHAQSVEDWV